MFVTAAVFSTSVGLSQCPSKVSWGLLLEHTCKRQPFFATFVGVVMVPWHQAQYSLGVLPWPWVRA